MLAAMDGRLTLVSAPAGFGKTDLLTGFAERCQRPLGWVSLSAADSDPVIFFSSLKTALLAVYPESGQALSSVLPITPPLAADALAAAWMSDIAAIPHPFVLILDDLHLVNDEGILTSLAALFEQSLPHMHLVVATRVDPPFPLARLRAHGQLTELRIVDLRFSLEETRAFLSKRMRMNLSSSQIAALHARTEGWVAGLQLAGIALQSVPAAAVDEFITSFTGSHRFIMDYLTDEVLRLQPDWIEQFLLKTAILDRITAPLCSALLTGEPENQRDNAQETLELLERLNLFLLPLDTERRWYRYHPLFADLLRHRLSQRSADQMPILHQRASEWFARLADENGNSHAIDSALSHAQSARNLILLVQTLDHFAEILWQQGAYFRLIYWIDQIPDHLRSQYPKLSILLAWIQFSSGRLPQAVQTLAEIEQALQALSFPEEVHGKAAVIRAHIAVFSGRHADAVQAATQALEQLPASAAAWRTSAATLLGDASGVSGNTAAARSAYSLAVSASRPEQHPYLSLNAGLKLAMLTAQAAEMDTALRLAEEQLELAARTGLSQSALAGTLLAVKGQILWERQASSDARRMVEEGVQISEQGGHIGLRGWSTLALARMLLSAGDLDDLENLLERFKSLTAAAQVPPWIVSPMEGTQALLWLARSELERVRPWIEGRGLRLDDERMAARAYEYWAYARFLLVDGQFEDAGQLLDRLLENAAQQNNLVFQIQLLLAKARLALAGGDRPRALQLLERALQSGAPRGFVQLYLEEGPALRPLLEDEYIRHAFPDFSARLLQSMDMVQRPAADGELVEALSPREMEVLQRIAQGYRNADIASDLVISHNTVLFHTKNIFSKLNVNNRTQAIARARELRLI
jgi:LuxR family transcriptional regulator, maltose regulon positive regulatory protein